jgi:hypothetical protein
METEYSFEDLRSAMHSAVDSLIEGKMEAGTTVELSEEVKAALKAAGMVAKPVSKVNPVVADKISDAIEVLKGGIVQCRVTTYTERPDSDKDRFENYLADIPVEKQVEFARTLVVKALNGVDKSKYRLFDYNPETKRMKASALDPVSGKWMEIGGKTGGWVTVGSLTNRIKVIVSGGIEEGKIITAS